MTNDHFLPKTSIFFSRKPNMNPQNPKRFQIEKRKTLGNIMKFQNLKLERERNLRSKNDNVLSRERVPSARWVNGSNTERGNYLSNWFGCESEWFWKFQTEWFTRVSEFESDFERVERSLSKWECLTESVSMCLNFESVWERHLKVLDFLVYGVQILSLINLISTRQNLLHVENLST